MQNTVQNMPARAVAPMELWWVGWNCCTIPLFCATYFDTGFAYTPPA